MSKWTEEAAYHSGAVFQLEDEGDEAKRLVAGLAVRMDQYKRLYDTYLELLEAYDSLNATANPHGASSKATCEGCDWEADTHNYRGPGSEGPRHTCSPIHGHGADNDGGM